jgi:hypothetical protein
MLEDLKGHETIIGWCRGQSIQIQFLIRYQYRFGTRHSCSDGKCVWGSGVYAVQAGISVTVRCA